MQMRVLEVEERGAVGLEQELLVKPVPIYYYYLLFIVKPVPVSQTSNPDKSVYLHFGAKAKRL